MYFSLVESELILKQDCACRASSIVLKNLATRNPAGRCYWYLGKRVYAHIILVVDSSLQQRGGSSSSGGETVGVESGEGVIAMTTTGAQYALAAASTGANNSGGGTAAVGVDSKPSVVVVTTTSSSNGGGNGAQTQSGRGQQLITVVTSPDPSSPSNLQPIQVGNIILALCSRIFCLLLWFMKKNYLFFTREFFHKNWAF